MNGKIICLLAALALSLAASALAADMAQTAPSNLAAPTPQGPQPSATVPIDQTYPGGTKFTGGPSQGPQFAPFDLDILGVPDARDLPRPPAFTKVAHQFVGVIKNKTSHDVSVPSANSGATIIIPARGFVEYTIWNKHADVTVYYDGKPYYCLKITAYPKNYEYMCKRYDFMAEIVREEPTPKPSKMKKRIKKRAKSPRAQELS
jgi:hypothetical protein